MFAFLSASSTKIFFTAILAVLTAGWINEALRGFGFYNSSPFVMLIGAFIVMIAFHVWGK